MSIFSIVYLGQAANPAMVNSVDTLSLLMLGFGVLGIGVTLLMSFKQKRLQHLTTKSDQLAGS